MMKASLSSIVNPSSIPQSAIQNPHSEIVSAPLRRTAMKLKNLFTVAAAAAACALAASGARAQSASVFAGGLKAPSKIVLTPRGNLIVAEGGDGPNKGRLSLIDRKTRARRTLPDGSS